jgi:hypothetical protein
VKDVLAAVGGFAFGFFLAYGVITFIIDILIRLLIC